MNYAIKIAYLNALFLCLVCVCVCVCLCLVCVFVFVCLFIECFCNRVFSYFILHVAPQVDFHSPPSRPLKISLGWVCFFHA